MAQKDWFIFQEDHHLGPFTLEEIISQVKLRQISEETMVVKRGQKKWLPIKHQNEIQMNLAKIAADEDILLQREAQMQRHNESELQKIWLEEGLLEEGLLEEGPNNINTVSSLSKEAPPPIPDFPTDAIESVIAEEERDREEALREAEKEEARKRKDAEIAALWEIQEEKVDREATPPIPTLTPKELEEREEDETPHVEIEEEFESDIPQEAIEKKKSDVVPGLEGLLEAFDKADKENAPAMDVNAQGDSTHTDIKKVSLLSGPRLYGALFFCFVGLMISLYVYSTLDPGQRKLGSVTGRDKDALQGVMNRPWKGRIDYRVRPTKDLNGLWFASNYYEEAVLYLKIKGKKGRLIGGGEVSAQGVARMFGGAAYFRELEVTAGEKLKIGEYTYEVLLKRDGLKIKILEGLKDSLPFLVKFDRLKGESELLLKGDLLLSPFGTEKFEGVLTDNKVKLDKEIVKPLQERKERYNTYLGLLNRIDVLYVKNLKRITKGSSISLFEDDYNDEVGPFLRDLIVDNNRLHLSYLNINPDISKAHEELMAFGKEIGELASDMVTGTRKYKKLSKADVKELKIRYKRRVRELRAKSKLALNEINSLLRPYVDEAATKKEVEVKE